MNIKIIISLGIVNLVDLYAGEWFNKGSREVVIDVAIFKLLQKEESIANIKTMIFSCFR